MLGKLVEYLEHGGAGRRGGVRIVAEDALGLRCATDVRAYLRYEAASNVVYARYGASVLCPYDAERVPEEVLLDALRPPPEVLETGAARRSDLYMDPRAF